MNCESLKTLQTESRTRNRVLNLVEAVVRTNHYQRRDPGVPNSNTIER